MDLFGNFRPRHISMGEVTLSEIDETLPSLPKPSGKVTRFLGTAVFFFFLFAGQTGKYSFEIVRIFSVFLYYFSN
jgi:hypothetical protein